MASANENNTAEYNTILKVIEDQLDLVKRTGGKGTITQKLLMYSSYKWMMEKLLFPIP